MMIITIRCENDETVRIRSNNIRIGECCIAKEFLMDEMNHINEIVKNMNETCEFVIIK